MIRFRRVHWLLSTGLVACRPDLRMPAQYTTHVAHEITCKACVRRVGTL